MEKVKESYLELENSFEYDESIERFQYRVYDTLQGTPLNTTGTEIRIQILNEDIWTLPCKSFLYIEGQLLDSVTNQPYAANSLVSLQNNAMMYLFSEARYHIGDHEVERFQYPGQTTTIDALLTKSNKFNGLDQCWSLDSGNGTPQTLDELVNLVAGDIPGNTVAHILTALQTVVSRMTDGLINQNKGFEERRNYTSTAATVGSFAFKIPLEFIFNFCKQYRKIIYGCKHSIIFPRQNDTQAIVRNAGVGNAGKVKITKIQWHVPVVITNLEEKEILNNYIKNKNSFPLAFMNKKSENVIVPQATEFAWRLSIASGIEKPRYIVVGFQSPAVNAAETNYAVFNANVQVINAYVELNSERFPSNDYITNYDNNQYAQFYNSFKEFKKNYSGDDDENDCVSYQAYKKLYRLYVFDVSKQSERLKNTVVDIRLTFKFGVNAPANTTAYAVVYHDRIWAIESDGSKQYIRH